MSATVFWTSCLVPIALAVYFALLRRFFPVRVAADSEAPLTDEERRVYRRWEVGGPLPFFLFATLLGYAWYLALKGAASLFRHDTPGTLYLIQPPILLFCGLPAIPLGAISSAVPMEWLYRSLLRDRYRRFERFCNERVGIDTGRASVWFAVLVITGSTVGFLAGVRSFARFDDAGVEIGRPLALRSTFYGYGRVQAIEHRATFRVPKGDIVERPHYVIVFDDGSSWSTRDGLPPGEPGPDSEGAIAQLVARRSGRLIVEKP